MAAALTLIDNQAERDLYLFDTFAGMAEPGEADREILSGRSAEANGAVFLSRTDHSGWAAIKPA
jgi:hypothetical protein